MTEASLNERVFDALMAAGKRRLADEYADAGLETESIRVRAEAVLKKYNETPVYSAAELIANPQLQEELLAAGEVVDVLRDLLERIDS